MTEPKHTPGPWFVDGQVIWYDRRELVCCQRGGTECCGNPDVKGGQEMIAQCGETNAHLIASAPDLYEALETLLDDCSMSASEGAQSVARAALAKARGETVDEMAMSD